MRLLLSFAVWISLSACSPDLPSQLEGKWRAHDGEVMEFIERDTVSIIKDGRAMTGAYRVLEDGRLKVEIGGIGAIMGPMIITASIENNVLSWTMANGKKLTYRRVE